MSDFNGNNQNHNTNTEPQQNSYQPPQYTQQYTAQQNGYQPPQYSQQYGQQYGQNYEQPVYTPNYAVPQGYPQKSRIAAALLAILFGTFGVHNFYLGNTGKGVAQLLLSTVGLIPCGLGPIITMIWCLYEGIQLFKDAVPTDGHGVPFID